MASQLGQDHFVLELLGGMRGGYFLESGAADGVRGSNTLLLESDYGWRGLCIEANDRYFDALQRNRRCLCVHCCLYDREAEVDFLEDANMLGGILEAYPAPMLRYTRHVYGAGLSSVKKRTRTIGAVLQEVQAPGVIDYWSLDTEGSELAILRGFPFDRHHLRVLTVEHNRQDVRQHIRRYLAQRGFRHVRDFGIDDCYVGPGETLPAARQHAAWRSAARRRP